MSEKTEFAERLKAALLAAGHEPRPVVVEKNFNLRYWGQPITFQAARRWLRGESIPAQDKLVVLAEWLGVDPHILRFGSASQPAITISENRPRWDSALSADDRTLIEAFLTLSPARRKTLRDVVQAFLEAENLGAQRSRSKAKD